MRKRDTLLVIGLCSLFAVASLGKPPHAGTTFGAYPTGTQALLEVFERLELPVARWLHSFRALDQEETGAVLFAIEPKTFVDTKPLFEWVGNGNRLVFVAGAGAESGAMAAQFLLGDYADSRLGFTLDAPPPIGVRCPNSAPLPCKEIGSISQPQRTVISTYPDAFVVAGTKFKGHIFHFPLGEGDVWYFTDATSVANRYIDSFDNLQFLFQLVEGRSNIYFDEFHHGFTAPAKGSAERRLKLIYLFIGLLTVWLLIATISRSVRFGPPTPVPEQRPSANVDFVNAVGLLYADNQASSKLADYLRSWRRDLYRHTLIPEGLAEEELLAELSAQGVIKQGELGAAQRALSAVSLPDADSPQVAPRSNTELKRAIETLEKIREEAHAA